MRATSYMSLVAQKSRKKGIYKILQVVLERHKLYCVHLTTQGNKRNVNSNHSPNIKKINLTSK